jgi:hypothetical protein
MLIRLSWKWKERSFVKLTESVGADLVGLH